MKTLYITMGLPGSGKTTYLEHLGLYEEGYVVSSDSMRRLLAPMIAGKFNEEAGHVQPHYDGRHCNISKRMFQMLTTIVLQRMEEGHTTILDSTACNIKFIKEWQAHAKKNKFRLIFVDFHVDIDVCKARNAGRSLATRVPEHIIDNMAKNKQIALAYLEETGAEIIDEVELVDAWKGYTLDFDRAGAKVLIVGDIHNEGTALREIMAKGKRDDYAVFLGDYIDRGPEAYETLEQLYVLAHNPDVYLIKGNHDESIYDIGTYFRAGCADLSKISESGVRKQAQGTLRDLCTYFIVNGFTEQQIKEQGRKYQKLYRRLRTYVRFKYGSDTYLCTHSGVDGNLIHADNIGLASIKQLSFGVAAYEYDIDGYYREHAQTDDIQIHGHQNVFDQDNYLELSESINLNPAPATSNCVRYCILSRSTQGEGVKYEAGVALGTETAGVLNSVNSFIRYAEVNDDIRVKKPEDVGMKDICSYNFSNDVFYNQNWYQEVMVARGLFINTKTEKIVARGYDKFFNLGENQFSQRKTICKQITTPIYEIKKENGYLGIMGYDASTHELVLATKTNTNKPYAQRFQYLLKQVLRDEEGLKAYLAKEAISVTFEVIDFIFDPHPIIPDTDTPQLVVLHKVENKLQGANVSPESLKQFLDYNNEAVRVTDVEVEEITELDGITPEAWLKDLEDRCKTIKHEGFVIQDAKGYMFKIKTPYYTLIKYIIKHLMRKAPVTTQTLEGVVGKLGYFNKRTYLRNAMCEEVLQTYREAGSELTIPTRRKLVEVIEHYFDILNEEG